MNASDPSLSPSFPELPLTAKPACFFDYHCDRCDALFCERVNIMNLALDYLEEAFCLTCLATEQEMSRIQLSSYLKDYILARDCFKTPWEAFNAANCPIVASKECFCQ